MLFYAETKGPANHTGPTITVMVITRGTYFHFRNVGDAIISYQDLIQDFMLGMGGGGGSLDQNQCFG